jgi:hypothetical protein
MGFLEVLTLIFVICKLTGIIHWSWFLVLLPEIIAFVIYGVILLGAIIVALKAK